MADVNPFEAYNAAKARVAEQGAQVRELKSNNASADEVAAAVAVLAELKAQAAELKQAAQDADPNTPPLFGPDSRREIEDALKRRFWFTQAFEIYGGVKGLYDWGPPGAALKANILNKWRKHFILAEELLEIDCTTLTPHIVLKTSGHVDRFSDFMVRDQVTNDYLRADHLLEERLEVLIAAEQDAAKVDEMKNIIAQVDAYGQDELHEMLTRFETKSPNGNAISEPVPFNLMFETQIGPTGQNPGYMRPETAQGMFVNFQRCLNYNNGRVPFGVAQMGRAYRNEISPRSGLLRVREFDLAEIEFFVHPEKKDHPKFKNVADLELLLFPVANQLGDHIPHKTRLGDAVADGTINNETLGYFVGRTAQFFWDIGIKPEGLRFRQHLPTEMAHYASDCWDAEIFTTYGWIEVVGHADRACYDLDVHSKQAKIPLVAFERYDEPRLVNQVVADRNKKVMGKTFRRDNGAVQAALDALDDDALLAVEAALADSGEYSLETEAGPQTLTREMLTVTSQEVSVEGGNFTPSVIEPAFGIGRIVYCVLEHAFYSRDDDEARCVVSLPAEVAPIKVSVLPLSNQAEFEPFVEEAVARFASMGVAYKVDTSSVSIGRRYARTDEIAVPYGITIDFQTVQDRTVTLRERDSTEQIRGDLDEIINLVKAISDGIYDWEYAKEHFPAAERPSSD